MAYFSNVSPYLKLTPNHTIKILTFARLSTAILPNSPDLFLPLLGVFSPTIRFPLFAPQNMLPTAAFLIIRSPVDTGGFRWFQRREWLIFLVFLNSKHFIKIAPILKLPAICHQYYLIVLHTCTLPRISRCSLVAVYPDLDQRLRVAMGRHDWGPIRAGSGWFG